MKQRLLPLLLALAFLLSVSAYALSPDDFQRGHLSGIVFTENGAMLVSDTFNKIIWQVADETAEDGTAVQTVTQFAGVIPVEDLSGEPQGVYHDGKTDAAFFMEPWAISPFLDGFAVSDTAAHVVRFIQEDKVYTLAGSGMAGNTSGTDKTSSFDTPTGLATGDDGTLYLADTDSGTVRTISTKGDVSTYVSGLIEPTGLCWHDGTLYIAQTGTSQICRVVNGQVQVVAGIAIPAEEEGEFYGGYVDGPVNKAQFDHPQGIAVDDDGSIYVADSNNQAIRVIRDGRVYTLAQGSNISLVPLLPRTPLVKDGKLYVTDQYGGSILILDLTTKAAFTDVTQSDWFADTVEKAVARGLTNGTTEGTFSPSDNMTRAMFVTMLSRMHLISDGTEVIDGDASFPDVPADGWYSESARWAADNNVVQGYEDGTFGPDFNITREQIVTMFYRYAQTLEFDASDTADLSGFPDSDTVSSWALDSIQWAVGAGIIQGTDSGLDPAGSATRAQVATIFINFMDHYGL